MQSRCVRIHFSCISRFEFGDFMIDEDIVSPLLSLFSHKGRELLNNALTQHVFIGIHRVTAVLSVQQINIELHGDKIFSQFSIYVYV